MALTQVPCKIKSTAESQHHYTTNREEAYQGGGLPRSSEAQTPQQQLDSPNFEEDIGGRSACRSQHHPHNGAHQEFLRPA
jgi:hypothetical protein